MSGPEPRFVMTPLIEAFAENRPADLFGTRGAHAPLVLVEFHAGRLEFQTAKVENSAHIGFQIVDHVLVPHA